MAPDFIAMKVLVCGSRNVGRSSENVHVSLSGQEVAKAGAQRDFVSSTLTILHSECRFSLVIAGDEGGAERLGLHWAQRNGIPTMAVARKKGVLLQKKVEDIKERNLRMLREGEPQLIVCFGEGENTSRLLAAAQAKGIEALLFDPFAGAPPPRAEAPRPPGVVTSAARAR
ncbi:MAG: hypothetical protein CTY15_05330 [Methylocystis sp.]|nr:MAG: hypothetical protein CTY15_05330 [Methylocystis sp.]